MSRLNERMVTKLRELTGVFKKWNENAEDEIGRGIKDTKERIKELDDLGDKRKLSKLESKDLKKLNVEL